VAQILNMGLEHIPPVTLAIVVLASLTEFGIFAIGRAPAHHVCVSLPAILDRRQFARLPLSTLKHHGDYPLYFNCASILWRGRLMEPQMGSEAFALLVFFLCFTTGIGYCLAVWLLTSPLTAPLTMIIGAFFAVERGDCAYGLGAVAFALKTIESSHDYGERAVLFGMLRTQGRYAVFVELLVAQLMLGQGSAGLLWNVVGALVGWAVAHTVLLRRITDAGMDLTRIRRNIVASIERQQRQY
jgi:hypothetical protein